MPVEQWLRSFDNAEFVQTNSFHGCIFPIIFENNFLLLEIRKRIKSFSVSLDIIFFTRPVDSISR